MNLESTKKTVHKSSKELYDFLTNVENFRQIMPSSIEKFEANDNSFVFAIKGMPEIRLVLKEKEPNHKIVLGAASSKLPAFTLTAQIDDISDSQSTVQILFEGDFNPMMSMMLKGPLSKFIDSLSEKLEQL
ncbi:MAG TPA: SRPBCC family protein [Flavobacteriaceae bacterium]|nr:SRPBCC family protein [Flavobacteriaceae bacterium]HEX5742277.1 SRPBCC family protein [Flavobacteriaceae bacterium]